MTITIQGTHVDLTPQLRTYVADKLEDAFRSFGDMDLEPVTVDVELEKTTRRHPKERENEQLYRAEATVTVPGRVIRAEGTAPKLKQAVVCMKHTLSRDIRRWREKLIDDRRSGARVLKGRDTWRCRTPIHPDRNGAISPRQADVPGRNCLLQARSP